VDFSGLLFLLGGAIKLAALDLLLCADNAVLIALACHPLPLSLRRRVLLIGVAGAIVLRFGLMVVTGALMVVPAVRLLAAIFLVSISIRMLVGAQATGTDARLHADDPAPTRPPARFWQAVVVVIAADIVMSLDNVIALVSVAQGNLTLLALGLCMSIPALMYGSLVLSKMFDAVPVLVTAGAVLLGWIAGQMATNDALISTWIARQAPALAVVLPALCACYVYSTGRTWIPHGGPR
jgi:YjbE family integral membrane protein